MDKIGMSHTLPLVNNLKSFDSFRTLTEGSLPLKREERELYEQVTLQASKINRQLLGKGKYGRNQAILLLAIKKGILSLYIISRYFKVISKGCYLAYFNTKPTVRKYGLLNFIVKVNRYKA